MTANSTKNIVIPVAIREKTVCNQTIMNKIVVSSSTPDSYEKNNITGSQTSFTCIVPKTDLQVTMTGPTSITKSTIMQKFTYRVVVKNISNTPAENVTIQNSLPNKNTIGYTSVPANCTFNWTSDYALTCSIGTLAANASYTLDVGVGTATPFNCNQSVRNTATVISQNAESNWMNNLARVETFFSCP